MRVEAEVDLCVGGDAAAVIFTELAVFSRRGMTSTPAAISATTTRPDTMPRANRLTRLGAGAG